MPKKSYLGVDIGTSGIKVVQLENFKGQPKLVTYGYAESKFDIIRNQSQGLQQNIASILSQVLARARVTTTQAVAALPTYAVFNSIISLPRMSRRDLATAIRWEAKKFIPLPIEDMILDWKVLEGEKLTIAERLLTMKVGTLFKRNKAEANAEPAPKEPPAPEQGMPPALSHVETKKLDHGSEHEEGKKNVRILLTAAPKNLVSRYVEIFKLANCKLLSLETEAFALSRSLIGVDQESVLIIDIGSSSTNICMIERGVPVLNRGLDMGGDHITRSISNSLNVSLERAEQFKLDFGIRMQEQQGGLPGAIKDSLEPIINEIQYVFDLYQNQGSIQVDRIVLSGGSAFLPNLPTYLSQLLKIPVYIGNPWDRIVYPLDLKPVLEAVGPQMAVSVGLAMRNI